MDDGFVLIDVYWHGSIGSVSNKVGFNNLLFLPFASKIIKLLWRF
jgi:hypothetical protein